MVKLVQNFRSHAAILKFPNDRFYNGDLEEVCVPGCRPAAALEGFAEFSL
jgi:hypothetical protein